MSRISQCLQSRRDEGKAALIPFITAGDPGLGTTIKLMHAMAAAGADIIELGVPFSDPMADGPVIQAACERALEKSVTLKDVLQCAAEFRKANITTPVVIMGYLNPVESMGYDVFAQTAAEAGVDGVLLVDLTVEESEIAVPTLKKLSIDPIFLIAPTSPVERIAEIARVSAGYLYYVSLKGVTGSAILDVDEVAVRLAAIKAHTQLPIAVGFGIRDAESAAKVARVADAVVVGSALVSRIESLGNDEAAILEQVPAILAEMRAAMDVYSKNDSQ